jgi:Salmonella virulence plasmid 65kDa B protein
MNRGVGEKQLEQGADDKFRVSAPQISLPKGGGAISGIGEKFAANPVTGTGSISLPIATFSGRSGFGPQLSLSYASGAGNGPFGFGWNLCIPSITRRTDKGLPKYFDAEESDISILSGAEDPVPVLVDNNGRGTPIVRLARKRSQLHCAVLSAAKAEYGNAVERAVARDFAQDCSIAPEAPMPKPIYRKGTVFPDAFNQASGEHEAAFRSVGPGTSGRSSVGDCTRRGPRGRALTLVTRKSSSQAFCAHASQKGTETCRPEKCPKSASNRSGPTATAQRENRDRLFSYWVIFDCTAKGCHGA